MNEIKGRLSRVLVLAAEESKTWPEWRIRAANEIHNSIDTDYVDVVAKLIGTEPGKAVSIEELYRAFPYTIETLGDCLDKLMATGCYACGFNGPLAEGEHAYMMNGGIGCPVRSIAYKGSDDGR